MTLLAKRRKKDGNWIIPETNMPGLLIIDYWSMLAASSDIGRVSWSSKCSLHKTRGHEGTVEQAFGVRC